MNILVIFASTMTQELQQMLQELAVHFYLYKL